MALPIVHRYASVPAGACHESLITAISVAVNGQPLSGWSVSFVCVDAENWEHWLVEPNVTTW